MSQAEDKDPEYKYSNTAWRESLPAPLTPEQQSAAVRAAKEYTEKSLELAGRINQAREEYYRIYERDPAIWWLGLDENFSYLLRRLEKKGVTFTEPEKIILKTTLAKSTVTMKTLRPDYVDDPRDPDPLKGSSSSSKKE